MRGLALRFRGGCAVCLLFRGLRFASGCDGLGGGDCGIPSDGSGN